MDAEQVKQNFDDACADVLVACLEEAVRSLNGLNMAKDEGKTRVDAYLLGDCGAGVGKALAAAEEIKKKTKPNG